MRFFRHFWNADKLLRVERNLKKLSLAIVLSYDEVGKVARSVGGVYRIFIFAFAFEK